MKHRRTIGAVALVLFVLTVYAANWLVENVGLVNVGFGLVAPAGVYAVGAAFILRDITQRAFGRTVAAGAILAGAALSYFVSPTLAYASAVAFLISEMADLGTFTLIERDAPIIAMATSNIVAAAVDSLIFLQLAFGGTEFFAGQFVGKLWITAAFIPVAIATRRFIPGLQGTAREA